ncbi:MULTISPECIES: hypothetical protein [unclassified Streptomyces]|uniref:hypothetical protein n=1 Tax=unclassified Streptomyces TaxID=2593676 RepID=UPI0004BF5B8F|nr:MULTISPECIES: hypothetical protein [unclassified Streptomyces]
MEPTGQGEGRRPLMGPSRSASAVFAGGGGFAEAGALAGDLLTSLRTVRGVPVPERVRALVRSLAAELVTGACARAPGPCLLTLEIRAGAVRVTVWDSSLTVPGTEPRRMGRHTLEFVMAACRSFEVCREPVGRRITATVALAEDPDGDAVGRASR